MQAKFQFLLYNGGMKPQIDRVLLFKDYLSELFGSSSQYITDQMSQSSKVSFRLNYLKVGMDGRQSIIEKLLAQGFDFEAFIFESGVIKIPVLESFKYNQIFYSLKSNLSTGGQKNYETSEIN